MENEETYFSVLRALVASNQLTSWVRGCRPRALMRRIVAPRVCGTLAPAGVPPIIGNHLLRVRAQLVWGREAKA
jgi:hypothetical protein